MSRLLPNSFVKALVFFGWSLFGLVTPSGQAQGTSQTRIAKAAEDQGIATIRRKLEGIIVPNIEFRSTTLEDAVEFLRQESRRLDPDPDPQARGLNIILRLPTVARASRPNNTGSSADPLFYPPIPSTRPRITLAMNRLPLLEALKYVAIQAGLKVRVDPYAVSLVPLAENTDALVTAVFRVSPTFIDSKNSGSGTSALNQSSTSAR